MRKKVAFCAVVLSIVVIYGSVAQSNMPPWRPASTRPLQVIGKDDGGRPVALTAQDYEDKESGRKALTEALEKGLSIAPGRNPASKEPVVLTFSGGNLVPTESAVMEIAIPGLGMPVFVREAMAGRVLVAEPGSGSPELSPSPDGTKWVMQSGRSIYLLSRDTRGVKEFTPLVQETFDQVALAYKAREIGRYLNWAEAPMWSADGTRVVFLSNRKAIAEGRPIGHELWSVDIRTGTIRLLYEFGETPSVSGSHDGWVVCSLSDGIYLVSDSTGDRRRIAGSGTVLGYGDGKLFSTEGSDTRSKMVITEIANGSAQIVEAPSGKHFSRVTVAGDASVYMAVASDTKANDVLVMYEKQDGRVKLVKTIPLPDGFKAVRGLFFLDNRTILASVSTIGNGKISEAAYFLDLEGGSGR